MSQNMLLFEGKEAWRYGISWTFLRLLLLRYLQSRSFQAAKGVIFLTEYARDIVLKSVNIPAPNSTIIPHGVNDRFFLPPRPQRDLTNALVGHPIRILYVSIVDVYKHQWHVVEAMAKLKEEGFPVQLDLIGPAYPPAMKRLTRMLHKFDPQGSFVKYRGAIPYLELFKWYHQADLFVFASSCENMPNILLEAMASGLPIVCSNRGPMPEVLGEGGVYFDPEKPIEIAGAIEKLIENSNLRAQKAEDAYGRAKAFTWRNCSDLTFRFIASCCR